jgi:Concanavalin A-like lectin/glucanases superfamily
MLNRGASLALFATTVVIAATPVPQVDALRAALTFHASFDGNVDAVRAAGDPKLYSAPAMKARDQATPGLPASGEVLHARGEGRTGDALRFTRRKSPFVFFKAARNVAYKKQDWSGTVSFWLQVDPVKELEAGFCDPVQITPRAWNDAAFFVEFEKRAESIPFRLGVYADFEVWNPTKRKFEEIPAAERPLVTVDAPPFAGGKWTHVVFTFERFNTGRPDGSARLYLDGAPHGMLSSRLQTFTWEPEAAVIGLGLGYIGALDDLSVFDRALREPEIRALHGLAGGVGSLIR